MAPRASVDFITAQEPATLSRLHGMLLTWDPMLLETFIKAANNDVPVEHPDLELSRWLTEPRGSLTAQGFVHDTMTYLAESSGGYRGTTMSPLTPMQSNRLSRRMGQIEMDRFVQACAKKLPEGSCLVSGTLFFQDPNTDGVPTNLPSPPPPHRQIFV
ncbi:uncharacterized protein PITG_07167 [Phytophthora infestans T30-4]|uniref:Uncharacterized protein n=2 Tax=Phytophthora infestans TaxID=4787 RepID=D0N7F8_PHYIT|nr:uncharacterized protein PITG_07167 [Phytophthora infestans T30-4]EEY53507.1 conserved hypothetical protein [Phytophthora infestans T30-4]KAF4031868.1 hypothetical protein GN244_ATG16272 [Phytophthora infestans]KAF4131077.1 hypothetical protein GN958_ATG19712 [Phytophthora infestans]|eukprot:XP_002905125.1 conserved hypothetical protein [Phytophthora infestans T30-4]